MAVSTGVGLGTYIVATKAFSSSFNRWDELNFAAGALLIGAGVLSVPLFWQNWHVRSQSFERNTTTSTADKTWWKRSDGESHMASTRGIWHNRVLNMRPPF